MKKKPDKYDRAIAYLTKHPERIFESWCLNNKRGQCLFVPLGKRFECGCPVEVKKGFPAGNVAVKNAVLANGLIPARFQDITIESLPAFAKIQRMADRLIRNKGKKKQR